MHVLTSHSRLGTPIIILYPKLIRLKPTRYLGTVHHTLFWRTRYQLWAFGYLLLVKSALRVLIGELQWSQVWVLDYWVTDIFGLELVETGRVGGLEDVFLDWTGVRATVHTLVVYTARRLLSLVIDPTLKQHLHPSYLPHVTLHSRCIGPFFFLLLFMLTLLPLGQKRIPHKHLPLTHNRLVKLTIVHRSLVERADRLESFHLLV